MSVVSTVPEHPSDQHTDWCLLASAHHRGPADLSATVPVDRPGRGAVARRAEGGVLRRAEPGPAGGLVLEARAEGGGVRVDVHGPVATPTTLVDAALHQAAGWAGCDDEVDEAGFAALVTSQPLLAELRRRLGTPRLSRLPRVGEALGRAVLAQLVQTVEARRSVAQVAALIGTPTPCNLWAWPTAPQMGAQPAWRLRRCAVNARSSRALHEAALADGPLRRAAFACSGTASRTAWNELDRRLRLIPGVGRWTAAEVRRMLADPDAVAFGDYNLPDFVGFVLGEERRQRPRGGWSDDEMAELLAPYEGQRARVLRLLGLGRAQGLIEGPARRAPRAALSAHRYW